MLTTKQEIFDIVAPHLVRQGRQSINNGICAYRGRDGLMCAVGALIPDNKYEPFLEGRSVSRQSIKDALSGVIELSPEIDDFLHELQSLHDGTGKYYDDQFPLSSITPVSRRWKTELTKLAEKEGLKAKCIKNITTNKRGEPC